VRLERPRVVVHFVEDGPYTLLGRHARLCENTVK
jgi:hypothetical protein